VIDARASADGVRAEGMELVSQLREMGDALRSNAERLLSDIQAIHSRMVRELDRVARGPDDPAAFDGEASAPAGDEVFDSQPTAPGEDTLEVPDFVSRG
jgi:hypothetical protein